MFQDRNNDFFKIFRIIFSKQQIKKFQISRYIFGKKIPFGCLIVSL